MVGALKCQCLNDINDETGGKLDGFYKVYNKNYTYTNSKG
jgi:hypothetical protein